MIPATDFSYGWAGLNVWLFALTQQCRPFVPESLISLLSGVGSFYAAPYFARAVGAQALSIAPADRSRVIRKCAARGGHGHECYVERLKKRPAEAPAKAASPLS